jgi:hypothetical protein
MEDVKIGREFEEDCIDENMVASLVSLILRSPNSFRQIKRCIECLQKSGVS